VGDTRFYLIFRWVPGLFRAARQWLNRYSGPYSIGMVKLTEQDHQCVKRLINPALGLRAFTMAERTFQGCEAVHMIRKGQIKGIAKRNILVQNRMINKMFRLATGGVYSRELSRTHLVLTTHPEVSPQAANPPDETVAAIRGANLHLVAVQAPECGCGLFVRRLTRQRVHVP
jgi:DDE domain